MKINHNRDGMIELAEWIKIANVVTMNGTVTYQDRPYLHFKPSTNN